LGVHTEMFSDGILPLLQSGALTNTKKKVRPGKLVSSFALGSKAMYDFMDDNPMISDPDFANILVSLKVMMSHAVMGDIAWVNDPAVIRLNPKVAAINSCIEIDLTGHMVSDSIGTRMYSGTVIKTT